MNGPHITQQAPQNCPTTFFDFFFFFFNVTSQLCDVTKGADSPPRSVSTLPARQKVNIIRTALVEHSEKRAEESNVQSLSLTEAQVKEGFHAWD